MKIYAKPPNNRERWLVGEITGPVAGLSASDIAKYTWSGIDPKNIVTTEFVNIQGEPACLLMLREEANA